MRGEKHVNRGNPANTALFLLFGLIILVGLFLAYEPEFDRLMTRFFDVAAFLLIAVAAILVVLGVALVIILWERSRARTRLLRAKAAQREAKAFAPIFQVIDPGQSALVYNPESGAIHNTGLDPRAVISQYTAASHQDYLLMLEQWRHQQAIEMAKNVRVTRADRAALPEPEPVTPENLPLLPALATCDNILVVGGKGSGKTSLLQHLEAKRGNTSVILDSHAQPGQWRGKVFGLGRGYEIILQAMERLRGEMDARYKKWSTGQSAFAPIDTYIDEFTVLPTALKQMDYDIQRYSIPMLTEGRKTQMNCIWGIHSDRVKVLGMEGKGDLVECFDAIIYLKHNSKTDERFAQVNFGEGVEDARYSHPGPFVVNGQARQVATIAPESEPGGGRPKPSIIDLPVAPPEPKYDSELERVVCEAYQRRGSKSAAYRAWYQFTKGEKPSSVGGAQFAGSIDPILQKYGIID